MDCQRRLTPSETSLTLVSFFNLRIVKKRKRSLRSLWQMISHNTAISSRTDCPLWRVDQSPYIVAFAGRLCCTR